MIKQETLNGIEVAKFDFPKTFNNPFNIIMCIGFITSIF